MTKYVVTSAKPLSEERKKRIIKELNADITSVTFLLDETLIGGVIYTVGIIPFAMKKKGAHFLWHFFVFFGAVIHWFGIYFFLY